MTAALTKNKTVLGYTESAKSVTMVSSCSGTVETVVETETDTDFAHARGSQRFMVSRSNKSIQEYKSVHGALCRRLTSHYLPVPSTEEHNVWPEDSHHTHQEDRTADV